MVLNTPLIFTGHNSGICGATFLPDMEQPRCPRSTGYDIVNFV